MEAPLLQEIERLRVRRLRMLSLLRVIRARDGIGDAFTMKERRGWLWLQGARKHWK